MDNQKIILPVITPHVSAYAEYAHVFSILGVHEESETYQKWAVQQMDNLQFIKDPVNEGHWLLTFFANFDNSYIETIPLFDLKDNTIFTRITDQNKFEEMVISTLHEGFYIIIPLDRYYIPAAPEYSNKHFIHQTLIYGYDEESKTFNAADMYKNYKYTFVSINIDNLYSAYCSADPITTIKDNCFIVRYNDAAHIDFSPSGIIAQLANYINKNDPKTNENIYERISQRLDDQNCIDYGTYQVLYEHKQYLHYKALLLKKLLSLDFNADHMESLAKLEKQALAVRNVYLRISMIGLSSIEEKERFKNELVSLYEDDIYCHEILLNSLFRNEVKKS